MTSEIIFDFDSPPHLPSSSSPEIIVAVLPSDQDPIMEMVSSLGGPPAGVLCAGTSLGSDQGHHLTAMVPL
jgi:hypothetical protein